jgi:hypothetical protein
MQLQPVWHDQEVDRGPLALIWLLMATYVCLYTPTLLLSIAAMCEPPASTGLNWAHVLPRVLQSIQCDEGGRTDDPKQVVNS